MKHEEEKAPEKMHIINIVDNIQQVNIGIWNAAIASAENLEEDYQVKSSLWYLEGMDNKVYIDFPSMAIPEATASHAQELIEDHCLDSETTLISTHGCWRQPTKWGREFQKRGLKWVYVPQGMLEPWSLKQKWLKKKIYFELFEKRLSRHADLVRAVSKPEVANLNKIYQNVVHIANGVSGIQHERSDWTGSRIYFLFMARLHHKKGLIPLVKAWKQSPLYNNPLYELNIAGPDDGELKVLEEELAGIENAHYLGAVYGAEKDELLRRSHFFALPSFSEGFPTSVLEGMQYGLIPIVAEGCNFPELFEKKMAYEVSPEASTIIHALTQISTETPEKLVALSEENQAFVLSHYSYNNIADLQYRAYRELLSQ